MVKWTKRTPTNSETNIANNTAVSSRLQILGGKNLDSGVTGSLEFKDKEFTLLELCHQSLWHDFFYHHDVF